MAMKAVDGVWETTTTTGTGTLTLAGAKAGYRTFLSAVGSGDSCYYVIRSTTAFELGIGTVSGSTLTRDQVITSTNANSPVNFGAGVKDVFSPIPAAGVAYRTMTNAFTADQNFGTARIVMDASGTDTYMYSPSNDLIDWFCGAAHRLRLDGPNAVARLSSQATGTGEGPEYRTYRNKTSPAGGDDLGVVGFSGNNSANAEVSYGKIVGEVITPTAGSHSGQVMFNVTKTGGTQRVMNLRPDMVSLGQGIDFHTASTTTKTGVNMSLPGVSLGNDGVIRHTVSNFTCHILNRKDGDGRIVEFQRDEVAVGSIEVNAGVITLNTFTGAHYSEWHPASDVDEAFGTVVCAAEGHIEPDGMENAERLPLARLTNIPSDRAVYGVVAGRSVARVGRSEMSLLNIAALGTCMVRTVGPIKIGDLLETSGMPGVARAQADDIVRSSTLGKATGAHPDTGEALVPCVLYCG